MNAQEIETALRDVSDQALLFHSFAPHMRDYDLVIQASADPKTGIPPQYLVYRFTYCVKATVDTSLPESTWAVSLDPRLTEYATGVDLRGYVWGVDWQELYPGFTLSKKSKAIAKWSKALGMPFYELLVEANAHRITLVFSDLEVFEVEPGYSSHTLGDHFFDGKYPLA